MELEEIDGVSNIFQVSELKGDDWVFSIGKSQSRRFGTCGSRFIWFLTETGMLLIYDAVERTQRRSVDLIQVSAPFGGQFSRTKTVASSGHSEDKVFVLMDQDNPNAEYDGDLLRCLLVIDLRDSKLVSKFTNLEKGIWTPPAQLSDGSLLIAANKRTDEGAQYGLLKLSPETGKTTESFVHDLNAHLWHTPFHSPSPDGRYWLRDDFSCLPIKSLMSGESRKGVFGRKPKSVFFGQSIEVWEAFPLRLVRRITMNWWSPDMLSYQSKYKDPEDAHERRTKVFKAISDILAAPQQSKVTKKQRLDSLFEQLAEQGITKAKESWHKHVETNYYTGRSLMWQPDSEAFWHNKLGFKTCVGVDGRVSPRLMFERTGLVKNGVAADTINTRFFVRDDRQAKVRKSQRYDRQTDQWEYVSLLMDGSPQPDDPVVFVIPESSDRLTVIDTSNRTALIKKAKLELRSRSQYRLTLKDLTTEACLSALEKLTDQVDESITTRAFEGRIDLVIKVAGKRMKEEAFFLHLSENLPESSSALKALIEKYVESIAPNDRLYSKSGDAHGAFCFAALALAKLDSKASDTLRRFGDRIDGEDEWVFGRQTVPAFINAHGYSDEILEFVTWVFARGYENAVEPYVIWRDFGLSHAMQKKYSPLEGAEFVLQVMEKTGLRPDTETLMGSVSFGSIKFALDKDLNDWERRFLFELEQKHAYEA